MGTNFEGKWWEIVEEVGLLNVDRPGTPTRMLKLHSGLSAEASAFEPKRMRENESETMMKMVCPEDVIPQFRRIQQEPKKELPANSTSIHQEEPATSMQIDNFQPTPLKYL